jgi:hypothetical protein
MIVLVETNMNSFMIISGHIPKYKKKEFEQTYRLASSTLAGNCLGNCLSVDIEKDDYYHFFSLWSNGESLKQFMESSEFQLMNGAFYALGTVNQTMSGSVLELKNFHSGRKADTTNDF